MSEEKKAPKGKAPKTEPKLQDDASKGERTFIEELEVAGNELVKQIEELVHQGNVRRLIIKSTDGTVLLEVPMTVAAVAGAATVLISPVLAALGALAALLTQVTIVVVREEGPTTKKGGKKTKIEVKDED